MNYVPDIPRDKGGTPLQEFAAPKLALARYADENASTSSVISVTHDTTMIELAAIGGAAGMRWVTTAETEASIVTGAAGTEDFDHMISADTIRRFAIPVEAEAHSPSVQGVNRERGLYQRFAIISVGVSSVYSTEY